MEKIRELLARLAELTVEELTELRTLITSTFKEFDAEDVSPETVAALTELADGAEAVMAQTQALEEAQAQAVSDAETARQRIAALDGEATEETDTTEEVVDEADPESKKKKETTTPEGDATTPPAATPAPVVAGGGSVGRMARRQTPGSPSPEGGADERNHAVLTASGALRGINSGAIIDDRYKLAEAMSDTLKRLSKGSGDVIVASATWEYPEDRRLDEKASPTENMKKIDAVVHPTALVATGGICTPVNIDYEVPTWATADRPLRDGLPSFQATRGGIRFVQPPDISGLAAATALWTSATDAAPGSATKPVLAINCGTEVQVLVDAVSTRLAFGNMQARFAPEQVAANTDLAIAAAARIAENNLLVKIAANCVAGVTSPILLGATRDFITVMEQALAGHRYVHRLPTNQVYTAILPDWLKGIFAVDMARETAHQQSGEWNSLAISDAQIETMLKAHGINPIWHIDGQPAQGSGTTYPLQGFAAPTANAAVPAFPAKAVWYLFPEGTFQFLDGGHLDLGVVRDATLDATNDYETFVETFEAIAYRGFANGAYQMVSSLCANGGSAGTISTAGSCA